MAVHIAILKPRFLNMILDGAKTVESRFTKTDRPPFNQVTPGEAIHLKQSGGPFAAVAEAGRVWSKHATDERELRRVFDRFADRVGVDATYWPLVRGKPFVTMIELKVVQPCTAAPRYKPRNMWAWYTLDDRDGVVAATTLTDGAIRNRYVRLAGQAASLEPGPLTLQLPDGSRVETELKPNRQVRWRGWASVFRDAGVTAGWRVRLIPTGQRPRCYRVCFHQP